MAPGQASLEGVPDDVLAHIIDDLDAPSLARLRGVSTTLDSRVRNFGIPLYLSQHPVTHTTLYPPSSSWPLPKLFNYDGAIARNLSDHTMHALQVGPTWPQRAIPALALTPEALLVGAGTTLLYHPLLPGRKYAGRVIAPPEVHPIAPGKSSGADIVGVHPLPGGGVVTAHFDGTVQRLDLSSRRSTAHYTHPKGENIHAFAGEDDRFLTASTGSLRLYSAKSPWVPPAVLSLGDEVRPWSALLARHAFVGISGGIQVCRLAEGGMVLDQTLHGMMPGHSAAYGLVSGERGDGDVLLSAWYDGVARVHDLRTGGDPVLELQDPWSDSALYSAAWVGGHGVAAGGAQHGTVSVWDVRQPSGGWSVFSPGGRGSPVYHLVGDGGRVWGVTERRAFVLAFDGSGDVPEGICRADARVQAGRHKDVPQGYGRRGRKLSWTVHYGEHAAKEVSMGYAHGGRGMSLFETKTAA